MAAKLMALLVLVIVAFATFAVAWLFDRRNSRARIIKDRLAAERKAPERAPEEELALLRDEQLSQIPALDTFLRRSTRVSDLQKMLAQADMSLRVTNFLGISALTGVAATTIATISPQCRASSAVIGKCGGIKGGEPSLFSSVISAGCRVPTECGIA